MKEETKKMLIENIKITPLVQKIGGQSCGIVNTGVKLKSDLGISITVDSYKSQYKNKALAFLLMELAIDEVAK